MNKETLIRTKLEIELVKQRISELEAARHYMNSITYYNGRMRTLKAKLEKLEAILSGKSALADKVVVIELSVPKERYAQFVNKPEEELVQFMKSENFVFVNE